MIFKIIIYQINRYVNRFISSKVKATGYATPIKLVAVTINFVANALKAGTLRSAETKPALF